MNKLKQAYQNTMSYDINDLKKSCSRLWDNINDSLRNVFAAISHILSFYEHH